MTEVMVTKCKVMTMTMVHFIWWEVGERDGNTRVSISRTDGNIIRKRERKWLITGMKQSVVTIKRKGIILLLSNVFLKLDSDVDLIQSLWALIVHTLLFFHIRPVMFILISTRKYHVLHYFLRLSSSQDTAILDFL